MLKTSDKGKIIQRKKEKKEDHFSALQYLITPVVEMFHCFLMYLFL